MKNLKYVYKSVILALVINLYACEIEPQVDPNNPSINAVLNNASVTELNNVVVGIEATMRTGYAFYVTSTGTVARELYLFNADPRNTGDLLGKDGVALDNNTFYLTAPYNNSYRVIKNCNILLEAIENTESISDAQRQGYSGFANTIKAYQLLIVLNMLNENGVRVDVSDPDNLGPFLSKTDGLSAIAELLNQGAAQLEAAGSSFAFDLSSGFTEFDTPATFLTFNRAIAARVAVYRERWAEALDYLDDSFLNLNGDLGRGPKQVFSTASGDVLNGLYKIPGNNGDMIVVHPQFVDDAEEGDERIDRKMAEADSPITQDGLTGTYETRLYAAPNSPIDLIRNEELILIYAEASIQNNQLSNGENALNIIRNAAGLDDYAGLSTQGALIDEMLRQRRYSLWGEGHRFVDLIRYSRINTVPIDRAGDQIFTSFPIPITEEL